MECPQIEKVAGIRKTQPPRKLEDKHGNRILEEQLERWQEYLTELLDDDILQRSKL